MSLSIGEYDPGGVQARAHARYLFTEAIRDYELESFSPSPAERPRPCYVLAGLGNIPLQLFQSLCDSTSGPLSGDLLRWNLFKGDAAWTKENTTRWAEAFTKYGQLYGFDQPLPNLMNNISPAQYFSWLSVREAVAVWSARWHLHKWERNDPWFFDLTLSTLHLWSTSSEARDTMMWGPIVSSWESSIDAPAPPPGMTEWDPITEKREAYLERTKQDALRRINEDPLLSHGRRALIEAIEKAAARYCDKVKAYGQWKEARDKPELQKHIRWAVRFQVLEETYASIAESESAHAPSVQREVIKALGLLKLCPRRNLPGRRQGQKDSPDSPRQIKKTVRRRKYKPEE